MLQSQGRTQQQSADRYTHIYIYIEHMCAIYSAGYLYLYTELRKPSERVKFDQPYLSGKVAHSF